MAGAGERHGFRATSLETLRHMVSAYGGMTLMPALSVHAPLPFSVLAKSLFTIAPAQTAILK